jgi:FtsH-binding integral membrane protein
MSNSRVAKENPQNNFLKYSSLGLQLLVTIGVAAWIGIKIDSYLQLKFPAFLLMLVFVSFGGMIYKLYRSINNE